MRIRVGYSAISRIVGVATTAWLCGIGSAWASGGGNDTGGAQGILNGICPLVGASSCPQLPTVTQIILAISDFQNTPPDFVRGPLYFNLCSVPGNAGLNLPLCSEFNAVTTVNPRAPSAIALTDLPNLTPLAFQAVSGQAATPVALDSPLANSFVYPVLSGPDGRHTLNVVFDYIPWTSKSFVKGQAVGSFTFPLVMLNSDNSETPVTATLNLAATCNGAVSAPGCLAGTVTGIPGTGTNPPPSAAQLGIQFGFQLAASTNSSTPHAIITFQLPVIVTGPANPTKCGAAIGSGTADPADCGTDPAYFGVIPAGATLPNGNPNPNVGSPTFINQISGQATAFTKNDLGFTPNSLGLPIGVSPTPAPLCTSATCPAPPPATPPATFFGFCATIGGTPAVGTFVSWGTDATAYASSPVSVPLPQCP